MPALVYPWTGCGLLPGPIKQWQDRLLNLVESCINWTMCVHIYCPIISSYLLFEVSIDSAIYVRQLSKEAIFMNLKHSTCLHILLVLAIIYTIYPNHKLCVLLWGNGVTYCIFKKFVEVNYFFWPTYMQCKLWSSKEYCLGILQFFYHGCLSFRVSPYYLYGRCSCTVMITPHFSVFAAPCLDNLQWMASFTLL